MYGGSSKLGRGGGGGRGGLSGSSSSSAAGRNRSSFPPPPPHRPSSAGRLSLGSSSAPRNNNNNNNSNNRNNNNNNPGPTATSAAGAAAAAVEENFSLVTGNNPLAFAMIIRLVPDLVEEIRRVEAQGGNAKIKFGPNPANPNGNVIDVGGKKFRFTWSPDSGDLCDIYEERESGEDGNGLLVESGCAWRKLNVQRVLDESTKNQVKKRSEEAERKSKSRKAIVLEPGNPSMKSQIKQLAAVETNPWRKPFNKQKKEPPFKKQKIDPHPVAVGGPPKSSYKSGLASTATAKGRRSASPLPSPPEQSGAPASPFGTGYISKGHASLEDVTPIQVKSKENVASSEKEIPTRAKPTSVVRETPGHKGNFGAKPMDLQSMLINLLKDNHKGMSLKALEKAIGDAIPNSAKKIEPIIKKIATLQAPGRYFLKPGVDLESFKKPSSESESSPEDNRHPTPAPEDNRHPTPAPEDNHNQTPALEPNFAEKAPSVELEQGQLNSKLGEESSALEKSDIQQRSPDLFSEKKVSDKSEGQAGSSSDSGSDSDSDSDSSDSGSDSGSHSRSRSRSRSPVGSGSGSSSDSESDAPSNSKEVSDEEVDIMTSDDDKEHKRKLQASEPGFSGCGPAQNEMDEKQDGDGSDAIDIEGDGSDAIDIEGHGSDVDIEKDLPDDEQEIEMTVNTSLVPYNEREKPVEESKSFSSDHDELQERQTFIGNLFDDKEDMFKDNFRHEQSDSSERISKSKSKRGPDSKHYDKKSERTKRSKAESLAQPPISGSRDAQFSESPCNLSPNQLMEDPYRGPAAQMMNRADREGNTDFGSQKGYNQAFAGKSSSDFQQSGRRSSEQSARAKAHDAAERPNKYGESSGHVRKFSERSFHAHEGFPIQREKAFRDTQNEDSFAKEKKVPRNPREGGVGGKHSVPVDSHYRKPGEMTGKFKDAGQVSSSHMGFSPKDNSRLAVDKVSVNGRSSVLQRELSDLELGELREPLPEELPVKKQFERKGSFKQSENSDLSKGKPIGKGTLDTKKPSPPNPNTGLGLRVEDATRSHHRVVQSQPQHLSRVDHAEVGSQFNRSVDASSKSRQNEGGANQGIGLEGYGESHKKAPVNTLQQHDAKQGQVSHSIKESKTQTSNMMADLIDGQKDTILIEGNHGGRKRRESSSDEDSCSYSKYEKDEPELKGPIKDFVQYKEYLQEFRDKYDSYCSLNKILESYRNEFHKLGEDLEFAKGTERYYKILGQLKESYRQCGTKHKRLKKIFMVLHEELKHLKQRMKDFALPYTRD